MTTAHAGAGRVTYRLLVGLNALATRPARTRVAILAVAAATALVLGTWGLIDELHRQDEGIDALTLVHGLLVLVAVDGPVEQVPWQLSVARVVAPLAAAGVLVEVALEAGGSLISAALARRSRDHVVVVGSGARVDSYVRPAARGAGPTLLVGSSRTEASRDLVLVADPGTADGWIAATNAAAARRVVLATGQDARTLGLLAAALDAGIPAAGSSVVAEVDDPTLALEVSVLLALSHPEAEVEVVCIDELRAELVAGQLLDSFAQDLGFEDASTAPHDDDAIQAFEAQLVSSGPESLRTIPVVAVVGDGPMNRLLVDDLVSGLVALGNLTSAAPFALAVVDGPAGAGPGPTSPVLASPFSPERRATLDRADLAAWERDRRLVAVVDFADPDETARCAVHLALSRPGARIWVAAERDLLPSRSPAAADERDDAPPGPDLVLLSHDALSDDGRLAGPFRRVARERQERVRARADGSSIDAAAWSAAAIRAGVGHLHRRGWLVVPTSTVAAGSASAPELPADLRRGLATGPGGGLADPDELVRALRRVGLAVVPPPRAIDDEKGTT